MRPLKGVSIFLVILCLSIVITSNTSSSQLSNNQAYASVDNNNNIDETIKKSCSTYQGNNNNNIKGLVTDILKACLPQSNQPPTSPGPDPNPDTNPNPLDKNIVTLFASIAVGEDARAKVIITDNTTGKSNSYTLDVPVHDEEFVIPVGDTYTITVTTPDKAPIDPPIRADIQLNQVECRGFQLNSCTETMGSSELEIDISVQLD